MKTYNIDNIHTVYEQHHKRCGSVLYSEDNGETWKSVGVDTGKWKIYDWIFIFVK